MTWAEWKEMYGKASWFGDGSGEFVWFGGRSFCFCQQLAHARHSLARPMTTGAVWTFVLSPSSPLSWSCQFRTAFLISSLHIHRLVPLNGIHVKLVDYWSTVVVKTMEGLHRRARDAAATVLPA